MRDKLGILQIILKELLRKLFPQHSRRPTPIMKKTLLKKEPKDPVEEEEVEKEDSEEEELEVVVSEKEKRVKEPKKVKPKNKPKNENASNNDTYINIQ